jgi:hypothetical protein
MCPFDNTDYNKKIIVVESNREENKGSPLPVTCLEFMKVTEGFIVAT